MLDNNCAIVAPIDIQKLATHGPSALLADAIRICCRMRRSGLMMPPYSANRVPMSDGCAVKNFARPALAAIARLYAPLLVAEPLPSNTQRASTAQSAFVLRNLWRKNFQRNLRLAGFARQGLRSHRIAQERCTQRCILCSARRPREAGCRRQRRYGRVSRNDSRARFTTSGRSC